MDHNDRQAIDGLFRKLAEVEGRTGPRDPEAEALIRQRVAEQPSSAYYMAQTIVVQEQALAAAQDRIQQLEYSGNRGGGLFGGLFGGGSRPPPVPSRNVRNQGYGYNDPGYGRGGGGGGFLAGAAQTAVGVAGGVLLANLITGAFSGDEGAGADDGGDAGGDMGGDFGGGDFGGDF
ncbi:MAG: DUF2076 domain-containing protein [Bauldia sp.]